MPRQYHDLRSAGRDILEVFLMDLPPAVLATGDVLSEGLHGPSNGQDLHILTGASPTELCAYSSKPFRA